MPPGEPVDEAKLEALLDQQGPMDPTCTCIDDEPPPQHQQQVQEEKEEFLTATTTTTANQQYPCRCTFAVTGPHPTYQAIFVCRACTDNSTELLCVCEACANACHETLCHDQVEYLGMGMAYCDCARLSAEEGNGGGCKLLEASQKQIRTWKHPIGTTTDVVSTSHHPSNLQQQQQQQQYIMEAYSISGLSNNNDNNKACQHLVEQARELIQHSKETFWLPNSQQQQQQQQLNGDSEEKEWCDLEHMAWQIFRRHQSHYNLLLDETGGAEWWVQVKQPQQQQQHNGTTTTASSSSSEEDDDAACILSEAVDLHYDKDEALAEEFGLGSFPTLSTVTYLTERPSNNNPTVVFPRTYEQDNDDDVISEILVSHPVPGKHLVFDGRLLHGAPAHPALSQHYKSTTNRNTTTMDDTKKKNKRNHKTKKQDSNGHHQPSSSSSSSVRVTLLVNIWTKGKPAGVHPLDPSIRQIIQKKTQPKRKKSMGWKNSHNKDNKHMLDFRNNPSFGEFQKKSTQELELTEQHETELGLERMELPFVGKGSTWGDEDDDDEFGMVLVTFPPPPHEHDTIRVRFGPGLQAYLDHVDDPAQDEDGPNRYLGRDEAVYEEAYIGGGEATSDDDSVNDNARRAVTRYQKPSMTSFFLIFLVIANLVAFATLSWQQQQLLLLEREPQKETPLQGPSAHVLEEGDGHLLQQSIRRRSLLQTKSENDNNSLQGIRVLVAVAAFDFSQLPHLEEVLDGYHDVCVSGASKVRVVIHTTVAWPVALLDMLQTRFPCPNFKLDIVLKLQRVRLHLVDYHRKLFYENLQEYDLFIYTEDDIRITPTTVATYLEHTHKIEKLVENTQFSPSDFNVGIVRYEYNFPSNLVIDDSTRDATENVTRVYWEHSSFKPPMIPNTFDHVPQEPLTKEYVHMKNHHQGMFLATRALLQAWKERSGCQFDVASNRPGHPKKSSQPLFGTQRVWMSSQQLYGGKKFACAVQQAIPMQDFGALTVHHLPNKNYRRVGKYRTRDMERDTGVAVSQEALMTAMQLHVALTRAYPPAPKKDTRVRMYYDPDNPKRHQTEDSWKPRLQAFRAYIERGGVMSEEDMEQTALY